jgi:CrcB protein
VGAHWLLVALGGAIGACARHLVVTQARHVSTALPWGTFVVNVLGCFAFGVIAGLGMGRFQMGQAPRLFLLTGVLGGFTTYSSFAFDTLELARSGQPAMALLNVAAQLIVGLAATWVGLLLTR